MSKKQKNILNMIFAVACFLFTLYYVFHGEDLPKILKYMKDANSLYWILGVIFVIIYILSESVIMHYLLATLGYKVRFIKCSVYSFVGFFFCCITPSATGGQPAQAVIMRRDDIPVHVSTVILLAITIAYKMVLLFYAALIFIFRPASIMYYIDNIRGWIYIGLFINLVLVGFMLLLTFRPKSTEAMVNGIFSLVARISKSSRMETYKEKVERSMENFVIKSDYITSHKTAMMKTLAITFIQRTVLFSITYLVCLSFKTGGIGYISITAIQAIISVAVDMLPLPGGMGITEHLFLKVFRPILGGDITVPVMIVSRGISYYTQLIISALVTLIAYVKYYGFSFWREEK